MRILVIGSEGNIGSKLVPHLRSQGHEVYRSDQVQATGDDYTVANICLPIDLVRVFEEFEPEVVYLLAAMVSRVTCEDSPGITVDSNFSGLNNVIQLCKNYNSRLVYFSTSEVYGNIGGKLHEGRECKPNNLYGLTKYLGEKLVNYFLNDAIIVRPFMFYDEDETRGDHRSAMIRFCYHLLRKEQVTVHKGSRRSWMHISDAVKVLERLLLVYSDENIVVNIGSEELIKTEELAALICNKLGINYSDYVREEPLPEKMTLDKQPDVSRQYKLTGIVPSVDLSTGIDRVIAKLKNA